MTFEGQSLPRRSAAKKQRYSSANYELPQRRQLAQSDGSRAATRCRLIRQEQTSVNRRTLYIVVVDQHRNICV